MKYIIFTVMVIVFISLVSCTTKEGEQTYATGLVFPDNWEKNVFFEDIKPTTAQPSSWDWRQHAILQPIRNQKSCGSCWSFSTIAVVETLYRLIRPMDFKIDLAEQTLVSSCSNTGTCAGGFFTAFNYIRDTGLPEEEQDPYQARNSSCKNNLTSKVKITRWSYIGSNPTTAQIKQAVYDHGSVSVDILGSFGSYSGGVYTSCRSGGTDHMVNIEGWVDDEAYSKYGGGYWIVRNSWGENWGDKGYLKIVYKNTSGRNCNGIGNVAAYAVLDGVENVREHLGL